MRETFARQAAIDERRPLLNETLDMVKLARDKGVLDRVNPAVLRLAEDVQPLGLTEDGMIVRSEEYDVKKPGVLVVDANENTSLRFRTTEAEIRAFGAMGLSRSVAPEGEYHLPRRNKGAMYGTAFQTHDKKMTLKLPRFIVMRRGAPMAILHELDHWDFALDRRNLKGASGGFLDAEHYSARSEKRAYTIDREIELKMNYCNFGRKAVECVKSYDKIMRQQERRQRTPEEFAKELTKRQKSNRSYACMSMSMLAISAAFNPNGGQEVNTAEIQAFKSLGVI